MILFLATGFYLKAQTPQESKLIVLSLAETCLVPYEVKLQVVLDKQTLDDSHYINWNFRDGSTYKQNIADIDKVVTHTYKKSGTFSVQATVVKNGGEIILATTIVIGAPDIPSIGLDPVLSCDGKVSLKESAINKGIPSDKYRTVTWDFGDGQEMTITRTAKETTDVQHNYPPGEGSYTANVKVQNQCGTGNASVTVRVLAPPVENFDIIDPPCMNHVKLLGPAAPAGVYYRYNWDFGDGKQESTTTTEIFHSYENPGSKNVKLKVEIINANESCIKDVEKMVNILESPVPGFVPEYTPSCDSITVHFKNTGNGDQFLWDFDRSVNDTDTAKDPEDRKFFPGTFSVRLWAKLNSTGCASQVEKNIQVNETPKAEFIALSVCENEEAVFTSQSYISSGIIDSIRWTFENGQNSKISPVSTIFPNSGNSQVKLIVFSQNCSDTLLRNYYVKPRPKLHITPDDTSICPENEIVFKNLFKNENTDYSWDFGDKQIIQGSDSVSHTFRSPDRDQHIIKVHVLASSFGCSARDSVSVRIKEVPEAGFISDVPDIAVCGPVNYSFHSTVKKPVNSSIQWIFNDGSSPVKDEISVNRIFENTEIFSKEFKVMLVAANEGCADTAYKMVKLHPVPDAIINIDTLSICNPVRFEFRTMPVNTRQYLWEIGGKRMVMDQNRFTQVFLNTSRNDSLVPIKYIAKNEFGCTDSANITITIPIMPLARFEVHPSTVIKWGQNLSPENLSENRSNWKYKWNFGETSDTLYEYNAPMLQYKNRGSYKISLKITDHLNCTDTTSQWVRMLPPDPVVSVSFSPASGCLPLHVDFRDQSTGTDPSANIWEIAGETTVRSIDLNYDFHKYGRIPVRFRTRDLLGNELPPLDTFVLVYKLPSANFSAVPKNPVLPDEAVYCIPLFPDSLSNDTYFWDFGDNQTSDQMKPKHVYTSEGSFKISLKVVSEEGCESYSELDFGDYIRPLPGGEIMVPNAFMPGMHGSRGGQIHENDLGYTVFSPVTKGVLEYRLEIYNRWGERIFESNDKNYGWDGYYEGNLCKQDAYVWKVTGMFVNQRSFYKTGTVTLFHSKK